MMNTKTFRLFIILLISGTSFLETQAKLPCADTSIAGTYTVCLDDPNTDVHFASVSRGEEYSSKELVKSSSKDILGQEKSSTSREPVFRGIYLSGDVFGYIYPIFMKDKFFSTEVSATANLKNRFFPVVEVGFGHTDMVSQLYEIGYSTRAPYYRIGMDCNMQYKNGKPNYIFLGARIGYTSFKYSVDAPAMKDPIWGDEVPIQLTDIPCHAVWAEAIAGVRAEIAKNFYMGWTLRYKYPIHKSSLTNGGPWYIPGLGAGQKALFGATYNITYYLNFIKKRP